MADAKIEIKVGGVSFTGEGTENWLSTQLDKMLKHLPDLVSVAPSRDEGSAGSQGENGKVPAGKKATGTLATFLNAKKATTNKTRKFLATALWLQDAGKEHLTTRDVTKAVKDNKQGSLGNSSRCLADNIKQGFCAKNGKKEFYVTDEGRTELD